MPRAVALFSGGLDSTLAIRILQQQGFEVEALNIRTTFDCCKTPAAQAASDLGVRLTVLPVADDYVQVIRAPSYGYGKGMNPCIDCRIYMCKMARRLMHEVEARVVITGEVVGQRPMSQKRRDLKIIARESGLDGRLLRPLSAKLLPPTTAENEGLIDRQQLYDFQGRGRGELVELARELGIGEIPQPSTGCPLTEVTFAPRVRDLMAADPGATRWDFELLNIGRHIRLDEHTKVVVGRNEGENASLEWFFQRGDAPGPALVHPANFTGPDALLVGRVTQRAIHFAGALLVRYTRQRGDGAARVRVASGEQLRTVVVGPDEAAAGAAPI